MNVISRIKSEIERCQSASIGSICNSIKKELSSYKRNPYYSSSRSGSRYSRGRKLNPNGTYQREKFKFGPEKYELTIYFKDLAYIIYANYFICYDKFEVLFENDLSTEDHFNYSLRYANIFSLEEIKDIQKYMLTKKKNIKYTVYFTAGIDSRLIKFGISKRWKLKKK